MRSLSLLAALLLAGVMSAGENGQVWKYGDVKTLSSDGITLFSAGGHAFTPSVPSGMRTPDGDAVLALSMDAVPPDTPEHRKQLLFRWPHPAGKGQRFRISFWFRGSAAGSVFYAPAQGYAPYKVIAENGVRQLKVTEVWQKASFEFTVREDCSAPLVMPRFMLGRYPEKAVFQLGPVTLERLDRTFASLLSDMWQYRAESGAKLPVDRIPDSASAAVLDGKGFDIAAAEKRFGNKASAVFYQEFDAPADGIMTVGMAADWWMECFINGESCFSNLDRGNLSPRLTPEDNVFNIPVRKGRNLVAVRVLSGSAGWRFVCGRVEPVMGDPELARLFRPVAGEQFRPVDDSRFLEIKPGTALDFSGLDKLPRPAGALGRLTVGKDGRAVFDKRPGEPVRFFAFNWVLENMWRGAYHTWDARKIDRFADAVARRGYNLVRIHLPEGFFVGFDILTKYRNVKWEDVKIPQTIEELEAVLDKGNLDRFDRLIAAFRARGVYVSFDLAGRRMITRAYGVSHPESFKGRLFGEAAYRNHWKLFTEYLMNRVNPYTKNAYKDEPAIVLVNFINEQDLRFAAGLPFLTKPFRAWLWEKYGTDAALSKAWGGEFRIDAVPEITEADLRSGDTRAKDTGDFLIGAMQEMTGFFHDTIRAAGYKGLVNHWDMIMRTLEFPARAKLPVIAQHAYFAHPTGLPVRGLIPKSSRPNSFVNNHLSDLVVDQGSSFHSSYFRASAAARFLDRPFFMTEYSHSAPNRFRHERGLYFPGYAALQDWDAIVTHQDTVKLHLDPFLRFDDALDPVSRANEALAALLFLRGDVKKAPHSVALKLSNETMFPKHFLSAIGDDYAKLAFVTRLGVLYPDVRPLDPVGTASPTLTVEPEEFTNLSVSQWFVQAGTADGKMAGKLFGLLRSSGIIGKENPTDPEKGVFVSETGELMLDIPAETLKVVTPRTEGAVLKKDVPVKLGRVTVNGCSRPAGVAVAAIDGEKTIGDASRLLLVFATNAFNTGQVFDTAEQRICFESGNHPALIETAKLDLSVRNGRALPPKVYALNFDGTRSEELPAAVETGELRLRIDTSKLEYGAAFFEIVY